MGDLSDLLKTSKLQGLIAERPVLLPGRHVVNVILLLIYLGHLARVIGDGRGEVDRPQNRDAVGLQGFPSDDHLSLKP